MAGSVAGMAINILLGALAANQNSTRTDCNLDRSTSYRRTVVVRITLQLCSVVG
jgi:hypothetical protein